MNEQYSKPKGFGEILDHTFRLCKNRFADFFMIALIILGPIYLLEAIILLFSGNSLIRESGAGENWFEQVTNSFVEDQDPESLDWGAGIADLLVAVLMMLVYPIAMAAALFAVNHLRKGEDFTAGNVIKQAFSKFWPILGSSILLEMIIFGMVFVPFIAIVIIGVIATMIQPIFAILLIIVMVLGIGVGVMLLLSRWGFYLGPVVMEGIVPGIGKSWRITKRRTWKLFGLFIVLVLITNIISYVIGILFGILLGNSVLFTIIASVVSLFTSMIFMVGYAVIYFDLVTRHDASDLKEMIADYDSPNNLQ